MSNNEITRSAAQLPDTIEDLSRFVLVGREKLTAVRAEIRAIEKVGLAREVHQQKLTEAQEIAEAVLDAEMRIGELTAKIPKATKDNAKKQFDSGVDLIQRKSEVIQKAGLKQWQTERFEQLARHPEVVEQAKAKARERGEIVTRQTALDAIHNAVCGKNKSPAQSKKEFLEKTKQKHEDFQQKKADGVVSMKDIQRDAENRETLARELFLQIQRACKTIGTLNFDIREGLASIREFKTKTRCSAWTGA